MKKWVTMAHQSRKLRKLRNKPRTRLGGQLESLESRKLLAGDVTVVPDSLVARQNGEPAAVNVLANDVFSRDYDGRREITSVSFGSEGGRVDIAQDGKSIIYAPPADFEGKETFSYFVDGQFVGEVNVEVQSPLRPDEYRLKPDGQWTTLDVLRNDPFWVGYQGDRQITLTSHNSALSDLRIAPDGKSLEYRASALGSNYDRFIYIVDGKYSSSVSIEILQPLAADEYELFEDDDARQFSVLSNDFQAWRDYTGPRKITAVVPQSGEATGSTLRISADGNGIVYAPAPNFDGWEQVRYIVDNQFETSVSFRVISPVVDDYAEVDENSRNFLIEVIGNDRYYSTLQRTYRDVVDRATSVDEVSQNGGTVQLVSGTQVSYTPPAGFSGSDSFTYTADRRYEATVNVSVTRPVRNDYVNVFQDSGSQDLGVLANDFLGNGYPGAKQIDSATESAEGVTVEILAGGRGLRYTPPAMFTGNDSLSYSVDGDLTADVQIYVQPLATPDYFSECSAEGRQYPIYVLADDNFAHGYAGPAVITSVDTTDASGSATISRDGKHLIYTPNGSTYDYFTYTVDGKYQANVSINLTNHLSGDRLIVHQNGGEQSINVLANDFDRNYDHRCSSNSYVGGRRITDVSQSAEGGQVRLGDDGRTVFYEPPTDFYGHDSFTYTVDGLMSTTVSVDVPRHVRDDQFRVDPGSVASLPVLANDLFTGYDGSQRITGVSAAAAGGSASISADGRQLVYQAAAGFVGTDTVTYTVDGRLKADVNVLVQASGAQVFPRFESMAQLQSFLLDDALTRYEHLFGQTYYDYYWSTDDALVLAGGLEQAPRTDVASRDFSETNVQVEGIDEADLMEFDADYLYMITGNDVVILDAWPAEELAEVSRVTIDGNVFGQFLNGDRLTVVSERVTWNQPVQPFFDVGLAVDAIGRGIVADSFWIPFDATYETIITVLDVSDRTAPAVVQETTLDGQLVQTRAIGDFVYVSVTNQAIAEEPLIIEAEDGTKTYETREAYLQRVQSAPGAFVAEAMPNFVSLDGNGQLVRSGLVHEPEDIYRPISDGATNIVSLVSFNVQNTQPGLAGSSGVYTQGASQVYASHQHFYVFENVYSQEDGNGTQILQFDWDATDGSAQFSATTEVAGWMVNQFSADEYEGHLRIATTINNGGSGNYSGRSDNDLFVLRDNGGVLEFTGSLQNLALGETIRSVRFIGPRAFVVTFRTIDPLFGLDVSDPEAPVAVGHLTLPGYSSYMQLIDENHLLTVGKNTPGGNFGPTQVSLFDVTDLTRPVMIDNYTFERFSYSEAEADHHAFGYYSRHGLLAVPVVRSYTHRSDEDQDGYAETRTWVTDYQLAVLEIDPTAAPRSGLGIQLKTEITHESPVRRSGYIDDKLYSIAEDSVHVVDVNNAQTIVGSALNLKPEVVTPEPIEPWWPEARVAAMQANAQAGLADYLQIAPQAVMPVTVEHVQDKWQTVVRVGETYYRFEADGNDQQTLVEEDFRFAAPGSSVVSQNPAESLDVNGDGHVAPSDALFIINHLTNTANVGVRETVVRQISGSSSGTMLDTNGDGTVSPLDALLVINRLNEQTQLNLNTKPLEVANPASLQDVAAVEDFFSRVRETTGDANLDGRFDSSDLVKIFQSGLYEIADAEATWEQGDWNGDRRFTTADLVMAFTYGKYIA